MFVENRTNLHHSCQLSRVGGDQLIVVQCLRLRHHKLPIHLRLLITPLHHTYEEGVNKTVLGRNDFFHALQEGRVLSLCAIGWLFLRMLHVNGTTTTNLQRLHHHIIIIPQEGGVMQHAIARKAYSSPRAATTTLGVACKLLVPKHVVVLSQGERIDTDALKHFGIELPRPVHKRRGKHAVREVALRHKKQRHRDTYIITHSFAAIPYSTRTSSKRSSNRPQPCHPQRNA